MLHIKAQRKSDVHFIAVVHVLQLTPISRNCEQDDQLEFTKESLDEITGFLLSDKDFTEGKARFLRKPYLSMPVSEGIEWRLHHFR